MWQSGLMQKVPYINGKTASGQPAVALLLILLTKKWLWKNGVVRLISDEAVMDLVKEVTKDDVLTLLVHF